MPAQLGLSKSAAPLSPSVAEAVPLLLLPRRLPRLARVLPLAASAQALPHGRAAWRTLAGLRSLTSQ